MPPHCRGRIGHAVRDSTSTDLGAVRGTEDGKAVAAPKAVAAAAIEAMRKWRAYSTA